MLDDNQAATGVALSQQGPSADTQSERALRWESDVVARILDTTPVGITVFDREGRITFANSSVEEVAKRMGIPSLVGRSFNDALWRLLAEDGDTLADESLPFARVLKCGEPVSDLLFAFDLPGGERSYFSSSAAPVFGRSGEIDGIVVTTENVTARVLAEERLQKSEKRYRQLLETLQEGIWEIDAEAITSFVNPCMAEMLGYSVEEMVGRHLFSFMDEEGIALCQRYLERRRQGIREQHDFQFLRKDGSRLYASLEASSIHDEEGHYVGALAGVQDITERVRAADGRAAAAAAAERERLARDLHDAVTQSLFSVAAIAEALPSVWKRDRAEAWRGLEELRQLTGGALAEMRGLLLELRPSTLEEHSLETLLHQLTEGMTSRTRIPVVTQVTGDCSLPAEVRVALYRVAQEALNNVVKHARASGVAIDLQCQPGYARLRVSDDGRGFDQKEIHLDRLGMGIMRERAQAVGARLSIESQPGQGTCVLLEWGQRQEGQGDG